MTATQAQILRTLNRPDALLAVVDQRAQILIFSPDNPDACIPLQNQEGGPFRAKDFRPLVAAGCIIPALSLGRGSNENVYRLWDIETAARAQGTQA